MKNNENGQSAAKQIILKDVKGFEGLYKISNDGKVWSEYKKDFLKPRLSMDGYERVALSSNGKRYEYRVSRLVAEAFVENPNNLPQVNHKDYNTKNNWYENLEWCDNYTNSHYSYDAGRFMTKRQYKVYTFTNVFNGEAFSIIGITNVAKKFVSSKKNFKAVIKKYANTGMYVKQGIFKGLRIDSEYLEVQRLESNLVDSSESKCGTPIKGEDIV